MPIKKAKTEHAGIGVQEMSSDDNMAAVHHLWIIAGVQSVSAKPLCMALLLGATQVMFARHELLKYYIANQ